MEIVASKTRVAPLIKLTIPQNWHGIGRNAAGVVFVTERASQRFGRWGQWNVLSVEP